MRKSLQFQAKWHIIIIGSSFEPIFFIQFCTPGCFASGAAFMKRFYAREAEWKVKPGGKKNGSNFNETITRSWCTLWTSDEKMEP